MHWSASLGTADSGTERWHRASSFAAIAMFDLATCAVEFHHCVFAAIAAGYPRPAAGMHPADDPGHVSLELGDAGYPLPTVLAVLHAERRATPTHRSYLRSIIYFIKCFRGDTTGKITQRLQRVGPR